ncbi:MAG: hypothetical protein H8D56_02200 [Planctomycetes bacterium]|nr:hypothetical protein [Planctomycetota bacterium]MBL7142896.1 hypothetical protein [Phycisphaerae bacterium]
MSIFIVAFGTQAARAVDLDLRNAVILTAKKPHVKTEIIAADMLQQEVQKRTGLTWKISSERSGDAPVIAMVSMAENELCGLAVPCRDGRDVTEHKKEGYRICVRRDSQDTPVVWIIGADARGILFGTGRLLRLLDWGPGCVSLAEATDISTSPAYPIRGHQLGYRARANSYDAWNAATYEQYIRDLILFGCNCIENIPFQDDQVSPHMTVPRDQMNRILSKICDHYDLDYWVWTPVVFDLRDGARREAELEKHVALYRVCPRLDAVFVPGGDPGENPPELLLPFLVDIGQRLMALHPDARVWLSLQWFSDAQIDEVYRYIDQQQPDWLGGLVAGPSSPPILETRNHLSKTYRLRHYPDITHCVRCQYPVPWWDPAFSLTLGRECPNPRPTYYAHLHNWLAPYTDGFLTYSDGIHDDVNKVIWSAQGWDPQADVREILKDYAKVFFRPDLAEPVADGILALEKNWDGALSLNVAVESTLSHWQNLEAKAPDLKNNWRWQLCLLRSFYDAYTRRRLLYETGLENEANAALAKARVAGSSKVMDDAQQLLDRATKNPPALELRRHIVELCDALFQSIGLQTSVKKHQASGPERGAVLDYIDYPLNNRWWLEDEFAKIRAMESEQEKLKRLEEIRSWENPGPGCFYDDVGNVEKSLHVVRGEGWDTDPLLVRNPNPGYWWWNNGFSRERLSWQVSMDWPIALRYERIDPNASYVIRITGYGDALTRINQNRVTPTAYGRGIGELKEFPVPQDAVRSGQIIVTWDRPEEAHLNWRQQSRITEIWLLKKGSEAGRGPALAHTIFP